MLSFQRIKKQLLACSAGCTDSWIVVHTMLCPNFGVIEPDMIDDKISHIYRSVVQ